MTRFIGWLYENMWQCTCGAWNPDSANNCGRCGK